MSALGGAVDVPAQGQGTMNNVTLGEAGFTYYETIGGGQGLVARGRPSGVHVAMSNTLNTVEALEAAYPLRVAAYRLQRGSGGAGAHRGGDGVERRLEVLADCDASVIAERRRAGRGRPPRRSRRRAWAHDAQRAGASLQVARPPAAGDVGIETPGGGGHGSPPA